jgi:protein tyrosine phosphatase (PTP) superfamily phosphohydrolase (DUF442 family)
MTDGYPFDSPNTRLVFDWLWTSGQLSLRDIARLPEFGIRAVVNLAPPTASNALPGEAEAVAGQGLAYVQIPVPWEQPALQQLQQFFGVIDTFAGDRIWVHCARNFRVSAFVYLYRRLRRGEPHELAQQPMCTVWEPDAVWRSFIAAALEQRGGQGVAAGTIR